MANRLVDSTFSYIKDEKGLIWGVRINLSIDELRAITGALDVMQHIMSTDNSPLKDEVARADEYITDLKTYCENVFNLAIEHFRKQRSN